MLLVWLWPKASEQDQSFATLQNCVLWDTDFKLLIKKPKIQKEPLSSPFIYLIDSDRKACSRNGILTYSP